MEQEATIVEYHGGPFDGRLELWDGNPKGDRLRLSDGSMYRISMSGVRRFVAEWQEPQCEPQN